jgi:hypothetical protein
MLGCSAYQWEALREDTPLAPAAEAPRGASVPLEYLAAQVKRAQVQIRIDCVGGQTQHGSAFVVKRSGRRAFLLTAWQVLHPKSEQCAIDKVHLRGAGIVSLDTDLGMSSLDELLGTHGNQTVGVLLFSVPAEPEGPSLQLADFDDEQKGRGQLLFADELGGPVVLIRTGQVVGVVRDRPGASSDAQAMIKVSAVSTELREQADIDLHEQIAPYGLAALPSAFLLPRDEEAAIRTALTRHSPPPFVLLTGPPGVGKSALANKMAWEQALSGQFPDGVVRLEVHDRPTEEVLGELHKAVLGRPPQPALSGTVNALASVLHGKRLLVVLDDLRMEGDRLPNELNQALAETAVLATSGRLYTDAQVQPIEIGTLPAAMARQVLSDALSETQRRALSSTDQELLCQRLGYNQLSLELAAGAINRGPLTVSAFLDRFAEQKLAGLNEATTAGLLAVVFEVVWQGLSSSEQAALRAMGLLAEAPLPPDMLAAVLDQEPAEVVATLDRLVAQHVLHRVASTQEVSMHPLVYRFVKEKAAQSWFLSRKRDRLVRWFVMRAQDLPARRWGLASAAHLLAAQEWAAHNGNLEQVYALAEAWHQRLSQSGPWSLWDRMWRNAVESALHSDDRKTLMLSLRQLARTREQAGYGMGAEPLYRQSLQIARDLSDQRAAVETLNELGEHESSPTEAVLLLKTSLEQGQPLGDAALSARTLFLLGRAHVAIPDLGNAEKYLEQSLALYQQTSEKKPLGEVMESLYHLAQKRQDPQAAQNWLVRRMELCESMNDAECAVSSHLHLAELGEQQGNAADAQRQFDLAFGLAQRAGDPGALVRVLFELIRRAEQREDLGTALRLWQQAQDAIHKSTDLKLKIQVAVLGASVAFRLRDYPLATEQLTMALNLCAATGDRRGLLSYVEQWNYLRWSRTNLSRQLTWLLSAREQAASEGPFSRSQELLPLFDLAIARIWRLRGEPARAQELIAGAGQYFESKRNDYGLALVLSARSALLASIGDHASPRTGFARAQAFCERLKDVSRIHCLKSVADEALEVQQWVSAQKCTDRRLLLLRTPVSTGSTSVARVNAVEDLAELALLRNDRAGAQRRYQEALGLWQRLRVDFAIARVLERMSRMAWDRGDGPLATEWLQEALRVSQTLDTKTETWARIRLLQAQMAFRKHQKGPARTFATEAAALFDRLHSSEAAAARTLLRKL